ncbi:cytochrome P450 [Nocardia sp. NPDC004068]|uniref:cytochrome P450 n=1 Tax=Nocardia sp. NPDC004068 TaxID=3364303 RepID=UPI0036B2FAAF
MTTVYPPGPRLPSVVQTVLYNRRRAPFLRAMARRYGDVFTLRMAPPYARHLVVFSRPEHVREIFAADPADLHAGEANRLLRPVMGEHSLLQTDEAAHARSRRLLMPAFTGSALRGYRDLVAEVAAAHVREWESGSTVVTLDRMNELTLAVILRVVFGVDERGGAELAPRLRRIVDLDALTFLGWTSERLRRYGPWKRFGDNLIELDRLLFAQIARRRAAPGAGTDVLSRLLAVGAGADPADAPLSDAELRDQLVTLLLAGHETTSSALAWALHELAAAPEIQRRARRAAVEGDDRYLEAVLKEALRRRPVIGGVVRRLTRDLTLCGLELPAGTVVATSIVLAHGDPRNHREPESFCPERFLDGGVPAHTWLPFGGGVRRCIGAGFSVLEGTVVLREILIRHALSLPPGAGAEHARVRNITHVPAGGARVVVTADPIAPARVG